MKKTIFTLLIGLAALLLTMPVFAATTVSLSPTNINATEGQNFNLTVKIDPQGLKNYTAKIELTYPTDLLRVNSFTFGTSWMPISQPGYDSIDNINGILVKTAGYPGGIASQATFGTISFSAKKTGTGIIKFGSNSLALDATNQNLLSSSNVQTSFSIATAPVSTPVEEDVTEEVTEEPATEVQVPEESVVKEEIPQTNFLADLSVAWGGVGQMTILMVVVVLCLIALTYIGLKEWKAMQKRKKI
ncbi:MAG: cohesin domain-containing protein [Patescibacteria group bacterium]